MKAILTLTFVIFFGTVALAQNSTSNQKIDTIEMGIVIDIDLKNTVDFKTKSDAVARIYKFKNDRIKKALVFNTKKNKAKLA